MAAGLGKWHDLTTKVFRLCQGELAPESITELLDYGSGHYAGNHVRRLMTSGGTRATGLNPRPQSAAAVVDLFVAAACAVLCSLAFPIYCAAQGSAVTVSHAPVFHELEGAWEGRGVLLDRPAEFRMEWRVGPGAFVRLSFASAWVDEQGNLTPVLQSEAVYLSLGPVVQGVWIDDRPQRIRLEATVSDSTLITIWTADEERGRSEYIVRSPSEVVVRDLVEVDGELRLFGEAQYRRRDPPPGT